MAVIKYGLSDAEYEIMEYVWKQEGEVIFKDVMAYLQERGHEWKKQTVQTFLTRLIDKKALHAEKRGNKAYYTPVMTEAQYRARWIENFLDDNFGGKITNFVCAFNSGDKLKEEDIKELEEFLNKLSAQSK